MKIPFFLAIILTKLYNIANTGGIIMSYIEVSNINKVYNVGDNKVIALDNVSFSINEGELVVILGKSGAGKSTLLNILGGMDIASSGEYIIENENVCSYNKKELNKFRKNSIGFIFQFYNLMPNLTALENVMLSSTLSKDSASSIEVLKSVGLENRLNNFPKGLSGGEQQRVSIARALVKKPKLLLCDEPTGALDSKTGAQIIELLSDMAHINKKTVIIVTHNSTIAQIADRVIKIQDGRIISNELNQDIKKCSDLLW